MLRFVILVSVSFLFASCNQPSSSKKTEMKVSYKVTVLRSDLAAFATLALPDEIFFYHSGFKSMIDIQAIIGNVRIRQIGDVKHGTTTIVLDYFNKRIVCQSKEPSYSLLPFFSKVKISDLDGDTLIDGLSCKSKSVVFDENPSANYTLLYSPLPVYEKINKNSPYQEVPGLLMRFEMHSQKLDLQLLSTGISNEALADSLFEIPKGYNKVSPATMRSVLLSLFGSEL